MAVEFGMAQQYSKDLSHVVKRGVEDKLKAGWAPWLARAGYLNDRNTHSIIKDPERYHLIRQAWDLMLSGSYTISKVLYKLNNEWGYRTIKRKKIGGGPLAKSGLYSIFQDPFYAGIITCKGKEYPGKHEHMIKIEEYDRVQKLLKKRGNPRPKIKDLAYRGFIHCGECGCQITGDVKQKFIHSTKEIRKYTYYACTRKRTDYVCSQRKSITNEQLENLIAHELTQITIAPEFRQMALAILNKSNDTEIATRTEIYKSQHRALEETQTHLDKLTQMRYRDLIDDEQFIKERANLEKQIAELKIQTSSTETRAETWLELTEKTFNFATYALNRWLHGDTQTKKDIVMALGQNFLLKDGKLSLELHEWFVPIRNDYAMVEREISPVRTKKSPSSVGDLVDNDFLAPDCGRHSNILYHSLNNKVKR